MLKMKVSVFSPPFTIRLFLCFLFFATIYQGYAQKDVSAKFSETDDFKIDGVLDEPMWQTAIPTTGYTEWFPTDTKLVEYQTEIKILYTDNYLYIGMKADAPGKNYITPSYERDFSISGADVINLMFDTYSDRLNAFLFGINPYGVLREGIVSNGGIDGKLDLSWDTKWIGEAVIFDNYCIYEIRIPMSSFKFKDGTQQWKFSSMRTNTQANTKSNWSRVPQNQNQLNLGFYGNLNFEKPLTRARNPISIIPYVSPSYTKDFIGNKDEFKVKAGFDVKIPVKSSLMLDLTVNPDFSNEDIVSGQNNVTRFEIKQEETRQFFIDNVDLFNGFGLPDDALAFYSRRIGLGNNDKGETIIVPISVGAKFTGKINNNLRIGILDVQTGGEVDEFIPNNNNLVVAAEQKIFGKSNIGAFFINRETTKTDFEYVGTDYNRVAGTDLRIFSNDNSLDAKIFFHKSFTPELDGNAISTGTDINLEKRTYNMNFVGQYVDQDFRSDLGYTKRTDIVRAAPFAEYVFYPETKTINTIFINASNDAVWKPSLDMSLIDNDFAIGSGINFTNGGELELIVAKHFVYLSNPFDPVYGDGVPLPIGDYHTQDIELVFTTDKRKAFSADGSAIYGTFYSGEKLTTDINLKYRFQPIFYVNLKIQYDNIQLPEPHTSGQLWYWGPTLNFTFTKTLFWNTDLQYSTQDDSFLFVSRLQWRYAPLSDVFLTYSDTNSTYNSEITPIEKGLYLKIIYWFDIKRKK